MDQQAVSAAADLTGARFNSFSDATRSVLEMLERQLPGSAVFVGHLDGAEDKFRIIDTRGDASFDLIPGEEIDLNESFCIRMAAGDAPNLSVNAKADPVYGTLEARDRLDIGSYVGVPLEVAAAGRIGSLCAIAHDINAYTESDLQLLRVLANMLSYQLERERAQHDVELLMQQLREQARTDPLTRLLNRRSFEEGLAREHVLTARDGIASYLVMLDLDGFKAVNDERGHAAGDELLVSFAGALRTATRETDIVGRLGGDEFAVVLVRALGPEAPARFAQRLRELLADDSAAAGTVQTSIGYVALGDAESPEDALERADAAMYADKRSRQAPPAS